MTKLLLLYDGKLLLTIAPKGAKGKPLKCGNIKVRSRKNCLGTCSNPHIGYKFVTY